MGKRIWESYDHKVDLISNPGTDGLISVPGSAEPGGSDDHKYIGEFSE